MEGTKMKVGILPNQFLKDNGTFDKDEAIKLSGKIAGVCYDEEGFLHLQNEPEDKTMRRVNATLNNGHHSVYEHIHIRFNLQNIPKILAMVLNNEPQYVTSEKSARFTKVVREEGSIITEKEENLYNKWLNIFKVKIKEKYGSIHNDTKIERLAQENARYLITVFMPTQMIYTTSLRQINYIASWMEEYIRDAHVEDKFERQLALSMYAFFNCLYDLNVLEPRLMGNEKCRALSLFGRDLNKKEEYFGDTYATKYKGTFAQLAQEQRHRTLSNQMQRLTKKQYFIPPIIQDDNLLEAEWLCDIQSVSDVIPQGELVQIYETGKYEDFILKCKERLCSAAQLEIMLQTKETLLRYRDALKQRGHYRAQDIEKYCHGARCTFHDYTCPKDCRFTEAKQLRRTI